ncbi:hypothetical protein H3O04_00410 [Burkholderia sp. KCJ3K979]|uniref:hypothetical protein n=1 Tax=Burkholderia sp. KCJ3K979 TaxID=2759149 RepID=UPI001929EE26|nr:hypothetical protein [Burkholderia sp. KCJ3K979]MBL3960964.1 hypothetical protein [Burkholderia sp. KCJ3K979]
MTARYFSQVSISEIDAVSQNHDTIASCLKAFSAADWKLWKDALTRKEAGAVECRPDFFGVICAAA